MVRPGKPRGSGATENPREQPRRVSVAALLGISAVVGLLVVALLGHRDASPRHKLATTVKGPETSTPAPPRAPKTRSDRPAPAVALTEAPIGAGVTIDQVEVDKREICRGEEAIVTIRARATDGAAEYLNFGVMEQPELVGPRFPLHLKKSLESGQMRVFARGKAGEVTVAEIPPIVVKDCDTPVAVTIGHTRSAAMMDRVWLTALVALGDKATNDSPFEPIAYVWDFGDGKTETTVSAAVEHSYEGRLQSTAYAYFFVTVTARDAAGRQVRGSRSLRFVNLGFGALTRDREVMLFSGVRESPAGDESIWLYHGHSRSVRLEQVTVKDVVRDAAGNESVRAMQTHAAQSLLGFADIPAGESRVTRDLKGLRPTDTNMERVVEISGTTENGQTARGAFNLLPPKTALAASPDEAQSQSQEELR